MALKEIRRSFLAGDVIFQEGAQGDCAYIIESGVVAISLLRDGKTVELAQRGPGDIFGEMAIIDEEPRSASVTAVTDCKLLVVTLEQLQNRLRSLDPVLRMVFSSVLVRFREQMQGAAIGTTQKKDRSSCSDDPAAQSSAFNAAIARIELEQELRRGIEAGQLEFHLQPIVRSGERDIAGFEALARWRHPTRGLVPPMVFIGVAEETGLTHAISRCAVAAACRDAARLRKECNPAIYVSANATPADICDPEFFEFVSDRLMEHGLTPDALVIEITETTLIENADKTLEMLERYRDLGVGVSIDDFGAGYSNFSYLARYPVQCLKVDKTIVDQVPMHDDDDQRGATLLQIIVSMARVLGLKLVAEGVENAWQADRLRDLGCDLLQGYYFGRPAALPPTEAEARALAEAIANRG